MALRFTHRLVLPCLAALLGIGFAIQASAQERAVSGKGWFYWPESKDKVSFEYSIRYNHNLTSVSGHVNIQKSHSNAPGAAESWRVVSSRPEGLAIESDAAYAWAAINGQASFQRNQTPAIDGYEYTLYVEDHDPGAEGADRLWLQIRDPRDAVVDELSMESPAMEHAVNIVEGDVLIIE